MITMEGIDKLRIQAGISIEDSFESGSKYQVGDRELVNLIKLAKLEAYNECIAKSQGLIKPKNDETDYIQSAVNITCVTVAKLIENEKNYCLSVI